MPTQLKSLITKPSFVLLFIVALAWLNHFGILSQSLDFLGRESLAQANQDYLSQASDEAKKTFLVLSALKAGLSMAESSRAGIHFIVEVDVQLGRVVKAVLDIVNVAWQASVLGMSTLHLSKLILQFCNHLFEPIVSFLLITFGIYVAIKTKYERLAFVSRQAFLFAAKFLILIELIIPLTFLGDSLISQTILNPIEQSIHTNIQQSHNNLVPQTSSLDMKDKVKSIIQHYKKSNQDKDHEKQLGHLSQYATQHIGLIIFDVFVVPFSLLLGFYLLTRKLLLPQIK